MRVSVGVIFIGNFFLINSIYILALFGGGLVKVFFCYYGVA